MEVHTDGIRIVHSCGLMTVEQEIDVCASQK